MLWWLCEGIRQKVNISHVPAKQETPSLCLTLLLRLCMSILHILPYVQKRAPSYEHPTPHLGEATSLATSTQPIFPIP